MDNENQTEKKDGEAPVKSSHKRQKNAQMPASQPMHELWGVVFTAIGLLILISLISHHVNADENILGPVLGKWLSTGLIWLFGRIASFFLPAAVIVTGIQLFRGNSICYRTIAWGAVITVEICVMLSISQLKFIRDPDFSPVSNAIGYIITYGPLYMVFGTHPFGPYFLFSTALLLSFALALNINIRQAVLLIWSAISHAGKWLAGIISAIWKPGAPAQNNADTGLPKLPEEKTAGGKRGRNKLPASTPSSAIPDFCPLDGKSTSPGEGNADETKILLEKQLAEFRSKRNEPIKIAADEPGENAEVPEPEETKEELLAIERASLEKEETPEVIEVSVPEADTVPENDASAENAALPDAHGNNGLPEDYFKAPQEQVKTEATRKILKPYVVPSADILSDPPLISTQFDQAAIEVNSHTLEKTLLNFGIEGKVVRVSPGPVVTRYEIELAPGVKISRMVSLHDDLALAVGGKKIRIEAPIPGKAAIGIELPNDDMQMVHFKHVLMSETFSKGKFKLPIVVGRSVSGSPFVTDITKMPHLLIAGQTGSGKSVCINSIICSLLMTKSPDELRLIMIDPKKVELSYFEGIPHLLAPVVTESKEAVRALQWTVIEMTRRYRLLAKAPARNIDQFNKKIVDGAMREEILFETDNKPMPFIVVLVDELADLMITSRGDVETLIQRIAQLARAVGIHLIVATQRPSTDIITGPIKANLTSRIAFRTISYIDSRTIVDAKGAEKLLGRGDMLFLRSGAPDIERYHGAYISEEDVESIVSSIRGQDVDAAKLESFGDESEEGGEEAAAEGGEKSGNGRDEKFAEAARLVVSVKQGSTSLLQRRLQLGFSRAGRVMDQLEQAGIVGPSEGSKAREVLTGPEELEELLSRLGVID